MVEKETFVFDICVCVLIGQLIKMGDLQISHVWALLMATRDDEVPILGTKGKVCFSEV